MRVGMKIIGLERHLAKLARIPIAASSAAAAEIGAQVKDIAATAVVLAPRDDGDLERGIKSAVDHDGDRVEGRVTSSAPHSVHIEYGTSQQPPQPFLRPATQTGGMDRINKVGRAVSKATEAA